MQWRQVAVGTLTIRAIRSFASVIADLGLIGNVRPIASGNKLAPGKTSQGSRFSCTCEK